MRYRCSQRNKCGRRRKLRKPIDQYVRRPVCLGCGKDTLKLDEASYRRKRALKCICQRLIPYPHERGTPGCEHAVMNEQEERDFMYEIERKARMGKIGGF